MTVMSEDIQKIAEGLSREQAKALCAIVDRGNDPWGRTAGDLGVSAIAMRMLCRKGLLIGGCDRPASYRFQDPASAVRAYLQGERS